MKVGIKAFEIEIPENRQRTGPKIRCVVENESVLELGEKAAKRLLEKESVSGRDIDLILFAGANSPKRWLWSPSAKLQWALNSIGTPAYDVFNGCNSLNVCIGIARDFLTAEIERKRVLIVIADNLSLLGNSKSPEHLPLASFGDSAAAVLIQKDCNQLTILAQSNFTDGSFHDDLWYDTETGRIELDADENRNKLLSIAYKTNYVNQISKAVKKAKLNLQDIHWVCMNQGSPSIIDQVKELMPRKNSVIETYREYGHLGNVDVLVGLEQIQKQNQTKSGQKIVFASSSVGYSWGSMVVEV